MQQEETPHEPTSAEKVEANRQNAQNSTGPRTPQGKAAVSRNAFRHGLSTRSLAFEDDEERQQFELFLSELIGELAPCGLVENMLVYEIAVTWWKLKIAERCSMDELNSRKRVVDAIVTACTDSSGIETAGNGSGLDCTAVIVKVGRRNPDFTKLDMDDGKPRVEFLAKLATAGETIFRYQVAWKKDFYRAQRH